MRYLTVEDVAEKLKVHPSYVYANVTKWRVEFKLPVYQLSTNGPKPRLRFLERDIDKMFAEHLSMEMVNG